MYSHLPLSPGLAIKSFFPNLWNESCFSEWMCVMWQGLGPAWGSGSAAGSLPGGADGVSAHPRVPPHKLSRPNFQRCPGHSHGVGKLMQGRACRAWGGFQGFFSKAVTTWLFNQNLWGLSERSASPKAQVLLSLPGHRTQLHKPLSVSLGKGWIAHSRVTCAPDKKVVFLSGLFSPWKWLGSADFGDMDPVCTKIWWCLWYISFHACFP